MKTQSTVISFLGEKPNEREQQLESWLESRLFNGGLEEFRIPEQGVTIEIPGTVKIIITPPTVSSEDEKMEFLDQLIHRNKNVKFYEWITSQTKRLPIPDDAKKVFLQILNQITIRTIKIIHFEIVLIMTFCDVSVVY
jgi:hypothetical protein